MNERAHGSRASGRREFLRFAAATLAAGGAGLAASASLAEESPPRPGADPSPPAGGRIPRRPLGKGRVELGVVGAGCRHATQGTEPAGLDGIVRLALDRGANVFEVSCAFGRPDSEPAFASALAGRRAEAFLVATLPPARGPLLAQVERLLKLLGTDRLDLCSISGAKNDYTLKLALERDLPELRRAKERGLVVFLGADCRGSAATGRKLVETGAFDAVTIPLSLVRREFAEEVLPAAESRNVGVIAVEPFNYGELLRIPRGLERILGDSQQSAHERSLEYALAFPVASVLVNWDSPLQAALSLGVAERFRGLSEEAASRTAFGRERKVSKQCRACASCLPCPVKIDIPQVHRLYVMATHYGLVEYARACYAVERVKARSCIRCGRCDRRCPFDLPVEETVIRAHAVLG